MKRFLLFLAVALIGVTPTLAYTVRPGDTLAKLAKTNHTTVSELAKINQIINPNLIRVGQTLSFASGSHGLTLGGTISGGVGGGYTPVSSYQSLTTAYISATATTIPVVSTNDKSGAQITLANISPSTTVKVYMNLEPGTSNEEPVVCTGLTATSWTNCTRGLPFQGSSETSSTTIEKSHNAGSKIIITNLSQFHNQFVSIDGNQTVNNSLTFTVAPSTTATINSSNPNTLATVGFVSSATSTGCVNASGSVKGCVVEATDAMLQSSSSSAISGVRTYANGGSFAQTSTANKVPVANGQGLIDSNYVNTSTLLTLIASTSPVTGKASLFNNNLQLTVSSTPVSSTDAVSMGYVALATSTYASSSFSHFNTSKSFNIDYVNTTTRPLFVAFTVTYEPGGASQSIVTAQIGLGAAASTTIASIRQPRELGSGNASGTYVPLSFIVPAGYSYKLAYTAGTVGMTLINYFESY